MALTKKLGSSADLTVGGNAVSSVKSANFSLENNPVDMTDNDSSGAWKEVLMGNRSGTFSFTAHWDSALTAASYQEDFVTAVTATPPTRLAMVYYPSGNSAGLRKFTFNAYVQNVTLNVANEAVIELTVTMAIDSTITPGTV